ncbi:MAG TPA: hypothetical protein VNH44_02960 [Micropepsaceae bacterium]|nr:hypothetical protein [Micropepsaceae bacterium]
MRCICGAFGSARAAAGVVFHADDLARLALQAPDGLAQFRGGGRQFRCASGIGDAFVCALHLGCGIEQSPQRLAACGKVAEQNVRRLDDGLIQFLGGLGGLGLASHESSLAFVARGLYGRAKRREEIEFD